MELKLQINVYFEMKGYQKNNDNSQQRLSHCMLEDCSFELPVHSDRKTQSPLLQLQIQLENGRKVYITPQPNDEPIRLATQFCQQYNLDVEMIDVLAESIKTSVIHSQESHKKKKESNASYFSQNSQIQTTEGGQTDCKNQPKVEISKQIKKNIVEHEKERYVDMSPQFVSRKTSVQCSLYQKGIIYEKVHNSWIRRQKQSKIKQQLRECTHQPKINKLSRSMVSDCSRSKSKDPKMDEVVMNEMVTEIFKVNPRTYLNSISNSCILQQRGRKTSQQQEISRSNSSIFDKLYENRKMDGNRSKALSGQELTHHPSINQISKEIVGKVKFSQRLIKYHHDKLRKEEKVKKKVEQEIQALHRPKVGHPPPNRNIDKLPIGDFLYRQKKTAHRPIKVDQNPSINQTSKLIYQRRKQESFTMIYKHIQTNDRVSWQQLTQDRIGPILFPILHPLIEQICIMRIQLSYNDFKMAMNYLFGTLPLSDRNILLNFKGRKVERSPLSVISFQPEINRRSQELVSNMSRSRMNIYSYCEAKEAVKLLSLESERVEKERREMEECTFQPKIQRKALYY